MSDHCSAPECHRPIARAGKCWTHYRGAVGRLEPRTPRQGAIRVAGRHWLSAGAAAALEREADRRGITVTALIDRLLEEVAAALE